MLRLLPSGPDRVGKASARASLSMQDLRVSGMLCKQASIGLYPGARGFFEAQHPHCTRSLICASDHMPAISGVADPSEMLLHLHSRSA